MVHTVGQKHVTCNSKAEPGPNPGPLPSRTCQIPHATKYTQLESRWLHCHIFSCPLSTWIKFVCFFFQGFVAMWFLQIQLNSLLFSAVCCWYCAHYVRRDLLLPSNNLDCIRLHAVDWSSFQFTSSSSVCTSACRSMFDIIRAPSSQVQDHHSLMSISLDCQTVNFHLVPAHRRRPSNWVHVETRIPTSCVAANGLASQCLSFRSMFIVFKSACGVRILTCC